MLRRATAGLLLSWLHLGCDVPDDSVTAASEPVPRTPVDAEIVHEAVPPAAKHALEVCIADIIDSTSVSGAAVAVVAGDETVWLRGFGNLHPDTDEPVDADTRFRVGSVTKVMTATLAMTLVAEDAIELDAAVADVLPSFVDPAHPHYADSLTVRQLLSHQGGLADIFNINGPRGDDALANAVLGETFASVPALVRPGAFYNYSNANYSVAGLVAERVSGEPFRVAVQDRVFDPLQMTRSTFDVDTVEEDGNYAQGVIDDAVLDAQAYDNGWARPAGFAWSSARDLARLIAFLQYGDSNVLAADAHAELLSSQVDMHTLGNTRYGLGLVHADLVRVEERLLEYDYIEHNGVLPGYSALLHIIPELDLGLAFVANSHGVDFHPCIAAALDELPEFDGTPKPADLQVEFTDDNAFVGDYLASLTTVGDFSIAPGEHGELRIALPTLDLRGTPYLPELIPAGRDNFYLIVDGGPVLMTGIFDAHGHLDYLRTRHFVARPRD